MASSAGARRRAAAAASTTEADADANAMTTPSLAAERSEAAGGAGACCPPGKRKAAAATPPVAPPLRDDCLLVSASDPAVADAKPLADYEGWFTLRPSVRAFCTVLDNGIRCVELHHASSPDRASRTLSLGIPAASSHYFVDPVGCIWVLTAEDDVSPISMRWLVYMRIDLHEDDTRLDDASLHVIRRYAIDAHGDQELPLFEHANIEEIFVGTPAGGLWRMLYVLCWRAEAVGPRYYVVEQFSLMRQLAPLVHTHELGTVRQHQQVSMMIGRAIMPTSTGAVAVAFRGCLNSWYEVKNAPATPSYGHLRDTTARSYIVPLATEGRHGAIDLTWMAACLGLSDVAMQRLPDGKLLCQPTTLRCAH
jgi:hypothetical protein